MRQWGILLLLLCSGSIMARSSPVEEANRAFLAGDYSGAVVSYQKAINSPLDMADVPLALYMLGMSYYQLKDVEMGGRVLWKLATDYPKYELTDNAYLEMAEVTAMRGNAFLTESRILYEKLLSTYPHSECIPSAYLGVAKVRSQMNAFELAEDALNRLIRDFPDHPARMSAHFELGKLLSFPKNPLRSASIAIQNFSQFTSYPQASPALLNLAWFFLGNLYWEEGAMEAAIAAYRNVVIQFFDSPLAPEAQSHIAQIYTDLKLYGKARESYKELIENFILPESVKATIKEQIEILDAHEKSKMQVSAWNADVNKGKTQAIYSGDVRINVGKLQCNADHADLNITTSNLRARGHIRLVWGDELLIHSDEMTGDMTDGKMTFTGNVHVRQKQSSDQDLVYESVVLSLVDGKWKGVPVGAVR